MKSAVHDGLCARFRSNAPPGAHPRLRQGRRDPFDFERRIMSVVVRTPEGKDRIISKGAPDAIFPRCKNFELDGELSPMEHVRIDELRHEYEQLETPAVGVRRRSAATTHHVRTSRPTGSSTPLRTGWACLRAYPA